MEPITGPSTLVQCRPNHSLRNSCPSESRKSLNANSLRNQRQVLAGHAPGMRRPCTVQARGGVGHPESKSYHRKCHNLRHLCDQRQTAPRPIPDLYRSNTGETRRRERTPRTSSSTCLPELGRDAFHSVPAHAGMTGTLWKASLPARGGSWKSVANSGASEGSPSVTDLDLQA